ARPAPPGAGRPRGGSGARAARPPPVLAGRARRESSRRGSCRQGSWFHHDAAGDREGGTGFPTVEASLAAGRRPRHAELMDTITFITGANKGLGFETARRLTELGHTVIVGARSSELGQAAADAIGARFVPIDVSDDGSVARAAADVTAHEGRVDTLINN